MEAQDSGTRHPGTSRARARRLHRDRRPRHPAGQAPPDKPYSGPRPPSGNDLLGKGKDSQAEIIGVNLLVGDALSLPFPTDTFACATAGFSLRNMPDVHQAVSEMARVVCPGGRVVLLELSPMDSGLKSSLFRLYFHRLVPFIGSIIARDRAAYTYLPQSVDVFYDAEELENILRESGLHKVKYRRLGFGTVCIHWGDKPTS